MLPASGLAMCNWLEPRARLHLGVSVSPLSVEWRSPRHTGSQESSEFCDSVV